MFTSPHALLSAEKMASCKGVSEENVHGLTNVSALWSSAVSLNQDDQSDCVPSQIFSFSGAATSGCFLKEDSHQVGDISLYPNSTYCRLIVTVPVFQIGLFMCNDFQCMCLGSM